MKIVLIVASITIGHFPNASVEMPLAIHKASVHRFTQPHVEERGGAIRFRMGRRAIDKMREAKCRATIVVKLPKDLELNWKAVACRAYTSGEEGARTAAIVAPTEYNNFCESGRRFLLNDFEPNIEDNWEILFWPKNAQSDPTKLKVDGNRIKVNLAIQYVEISDDEISCHRTGDHLFERSGRRALIQN